MKNIRKSKNKKENGYFHTLSMEKETGVSGDCCKNKKEKCYLCYLRSLPTEGKQNDNNVATCFIEKEDKLKDFSIEEMFGGSIYQSIFSAELHALLTMELLTSNNKEEVKQKIKNNFIEWAKIGFDHMFDKVNENVEETKAERREYKKKNKKTTTKTKNKKEHWLMLFRQSSRDFTMISTKQTVEIRENLLLE